MISRKELKAQAKEQIKANGNIGMFLLCFIVMVVVLYAVMFLGGLLGGLIGAATKNFVAIFIIAYVLVLIAILVVASPMTVGSHMICLDMTYGEPIKVSTLFAPFKNMLGKSVLTLVLYTIYLYLWSLLFAIPGIIKSFSYSMTFYVLAENPNMTANEAITESRRIMDGHKWELFVLQLSFIPWMLLGSVTLGLGYIYVAPYMSATVTNFYHNIKRQPENVEAVEATVIE